VTDCAVALDAGRTNPAGRPPSCRMDANFDPEAPVPGPMLVRMVCGPHRVPDGGHHRIQLHDNLAICNANSSRARLRLTLIGLTTDISVK